MQEVKDVNIEYESDIASKYVVVNIYDENMIQDYQIKMIENNPTSYILPFNIRRKNNDTKIYYDITSKVSLEQFLKKNNVSKQEFLNILSGIVKTLSLCKNYFLWDKSFIIKDKYIYINPSTMEISMIYIPMKIEENVCRQLKSFIADLIVNSVIIDYKEGDNFLSRILSYIKSETFNITDFNKLLKELEGKSFISSNKEPKSLSPIKNNTCKDKDNTCKKEVKLKAKMVYKRNVILAAILLQVLLIIVIILVCQNAFSDSQADSASYVGLAVVFGAIDYLLLKKILNKKNMVEVKAEQNKNDDNIKMFKREICSNQTNSTFSSLDEKQENEGDTVLLCEEKFKKPYLIKSNNGVLDKIAINKSIFTIGRLSEKVDYVIPNKVVGRVHAQFMIKDGNYYLKDLNSKNGTFINEIKIKSNTFYEIKNHDKICFANSEYEFIVEE